MEYYNLTFPVCKGTGCEKPVQELMRPDDRILSYEGLSIEDVQSCFLEAEQQLSDNAPKEVRERLTIARELATYGYFRWEFFTVSLLWSLTAIEMALRYKFNEVNSPPYTFINKKGETRQVKDPIWVSLRLFNKGWRIKGMEEFNASFRSLMNWAVKEKLIPDNIPIYLQELKNSYLNMFLVEEFTEKAKKEGLIQSESLSWGAIQELWESLPEEKKCHFLGTNAQILAKEIPSLRNELVHPDVFNPTQIPRSAIDGYRQAIEVVNSLWPRQVLSAG